MLPISVVTDRSTDEYRSLFLIITLPLWSFSCHASFNVTSVCCIFGIYLYLYTASSLCVYQFRICAVLPVCREAIISNRRHRSAAFINPDFGNSAVASDVCPVANPAGYYWCFILVSLASEFVLVSAVCRDAYCALALKPDAYFFHTQREPNRLNKVATFNAYQNLILLSLRSSSPFPLRKGVLQVHSFALACTILVSPITCTSPTLLTFIISFGVNFLCLLIVTIKIEKCE